MPTSKLIQWETPFSKALYPSVIPRYERKLNGTSILQIKVMAANLPYFVVDVAEPLAFVCLDESCAPPRDFSNTELEKAESCSWQWINSPWIESYQGCNYDAEANPVPLNHYFVFGGDNIIEIVCRNAPIITER